MLESNSSTAIPSSVVTPFFSLPTKDGEEASTSGSSFKLVNMPFDETNTKDSLSVSEQR